MSTPFDLQWGDSVWAKVVASNDYGDSIESYAGNGALLMTVPDAPINLAEDVSLRTEYSITITWQEGVHNGGRQVIDYRVSYAEVNSDTWLIAAETVTKQNFWTTTGLTAGQTYKFKVESRNQLYYSDFSDSIEILCATKPETPNAPWNENILDQVNIYWQPSVDNGLPITSYILVIRTADNIYLQDLDNCDGSDSTIVQTTQCTVPLSTLTTAPYNLAVNEAINVMVAATNAYGTSDYSEIGSGALLQLVPDSPVNLVNVPDVTDATKIKIEWDDGPEHGGSTIIDYTVNYDQSTG